MENATVRAACARFEVDSVLYVAIAMTDHEAKMLADEATSPVLYASLGVGTRTGSKIYDVNLSDQTPLVRPGSGMRAIVEPKYWYDLSGKRWRTLRVIGRIKYRHPGALALREFVFKRDGNRCLHCGATEGLVCDHIISRRNGGSHHPWNLQTLCDPCNARKTVTVDRKGLEK